MSDLDILPARIRQLSSIPADFARPLKPLDVLGMLALELLGTCYLADELPSSNRHKLLLT